MPFSQKFKRFKPLFDFLFAYWLYGLTLIGIHEFFHSNVARMLGYKSVVIFYWLSGYTIVQNIILNPLHLFFISISGGFLTALLYTFMLYFLDWETDYPEILAIKTHVYTQIVYAVIETYYIFGYLCFEVLLILYTILSMIVFLVMSIVLVKTVVEALDC